MIWILTLMATCAEGISRFLFCLLVVISIGYYFTSDKTDYLYYLGSEVRDVVNHLQGEQFVADLGQNIQVIAGKFEAGYDGVGQ